MYGFIGIELVVIEWLIIVIELWYINTFVSKKQSFIDAINLLIISVPLLIPIKRFNVHISM